MPQSTVPFDTARLDRLMDVAGVDVLLATSKHNTQYLLGGYRFFFFEHADAIGQSRYLPIVVYPKGRPDRAGYIGCAMEKGQQEVAPLWVADARNVSGGSVDAMRHALDYLNQARIPAKRIAAELAFLPADAFGTLRQGLPQAEIVDALPMLERLRARKSADEIEKLRRASDGVIDAMLAVTTDAQPGTTKRELVEALRREETARGLEFEYCLITAGTSLNRAPSDQPWNAGDILSLDSGGNFHGYIGDVCRMAILGEPDPELRELLAEVDAVQQAAMGAVSAGAPGRAIYAAANGVLQVAPDRAHMDFVAHGMGLVSHEVPHLTDGGPIPYPAEDADRPLDDAMVLSLETTLKHPRRGFVKLEDTVLVKERGCEILGIAGRGWNRGGTRTGLRAAV